MFKRGDNVVVIYSELAGNVSQKGIIWKHLGGGYYLVMLESDPYDDIKSQDWIQLDPEPRTYNQRNQH
jgi:hypothetical protein